MSSSNNKPLEKHASFLESTVSECYELDLPPVPAGLLRDGNSTRYRPPPKRLPMKAESPVYTNVNRTLSSGLEETTSPSDIQLSTIVEMEDHHTSDDDGSTTSDIREDVSKIYKNSATRDNPNGKANGTTPSLDYTTLQCSTFENPSIYEIPVKDGSTVESQASLRESPEIGGHKTDYIEMGRTFSTSGILNEKRKQRSWIHHTLHRKYMNMKMVGMKNCCGSHDGAKKFFMLLGVILFVLLTAIMGVVIGASSWIIMRDRANMIEGDLDTYTASLRECRIGRNWRSLTIDESSALDYLVSNDSTLDINLNNLATVSNITAKQLLLYIVIRSSGTGSNASNNVDMLDTMGMPSYINIALWTQQPAQERKRRIRFRQYMSILNNAQTPQIVSRSFWFPLQGTDNHFYVTPTLVVGGEDEEMGTLDFRVQLAGYC